MEMSPEKIQTAPHIAAGHAPGEALVVPATGPPAPVFLFNTTFAAAQTSGVPGFSFTGFGTFGAAQAPQAVPSSSSPKERVRRVAHDPGPSLGRNREASTESETFEEMPQTIRNKRMMEGDPPPRLGRHRGASAERETCEEEPPMYARTMERDPLQRLGRNRGASTEPETVERAPQTVPYKRMMEGDPPPRLGRNRGGGVSTEWEIFEREKFEGALVPFEKLMEGDPPPRLGKSRGVTFGERGGSSRGKLVASIEEERKNWSGCSIFKIPKGLRDMDPDSYTPKMVSIGPVHRSESHLKPMQEHKRRFLARILARAQRSLDFYISAISEFKDRARDCYSWRTEDEISDQEFEQMLLLDACFIVELFLARDQGYVSLGYSPDDPIFAARGLLKWIQRDLLLLENQIPLFIVNRVLQITTSCGSSVAALALDFFQSAIPGYVRSPDAHAATSEEIKEEELHLLGFVRQCVVPSKWLARGNRQPEAKPNAKFYQVMLPSISTLKDSGVKFVREESRRLTEVDFDLEHGMLRVPPLVIDDAISTFLKNLTAFEQCYPHCHDEMSLYVTFLDELIDSPQDVAYLQHEGIIDNRLGSHEEVAKRFNQACREIVTERIPGSHLADLEKKLKQHLEKRCPRWRVSLNHEYFRHPWSIVSVVAAAILLGLTIMQVVYAMISYHLPPK